MVGRRLRAAGGGALGGGRAPGRGADAGTDRRAVRDYLARIGGGLPGYDGVTGTIAFDARGDVPAKPVVIGVVRGGRIVTEAAQ